MIYKIEKYQKKKLKNSQKRTCCISAGATGTSGSGCAGDYDEAAFNECMSESKND